MFHSSERLRFLSTISYPAIDIEEGRFTFITGESGCGKSSYLKILNRTIPVKDGLVEYKAKDINESDVLEYRKRVMLIPQEVFLFEESIEENFDTYYEMRGEKKLTKEEIIKYLRICCLEIPLTAQTSILSGGEKQRVFQAIYLSCKPEVILLDEPTAALDEATANELLSNVKDFCKDNSITAICVSHNEELTRKFADTQIKLGVRK